jgi:DNA-binding XRE family transcriptional regulator
MNAPLMTPRRFSPETDSPEWAAWYVATRLLDVEYVGRMEAIVFRFGDGRIFGVPLRELKELDATPVTRISLVYDGDAALVEQFSGNQTEVPWDYVLHLADPTYDYRRPSPGQAADPQEGERDRAIGARVRQERLARSWTLADLSTRTGIKVPNLSRLEKGKHSPSLDTLVKVADAFGTGVARLLR